MLRMHKKTNKIQFYHITDKAKNNQRIKRNEENVCVFVCVCVRARVCVCVCVWMLGGDRLVYLND